MKIENIYLQNLQSHEETSLDLHRGINIIIGPSDSGKTGILRGLRLLFENKPAGQSYRSNWGGETIVAVTLNSGDVVKRVRGNKTNEYHLNDMVFKAIKTDVPDEIAEALNINEINVQQQLEGPFLLNKSPGEVAQHFNRVAGLDKIDTALFNLNGKIRGINSTIKHEEQQEKQLKEKLSAYNYLDDIEKQVEDVERLNSYRTGRTNERKAINAIVVEADQIEQQVTTKQPLTDLEPLVTKSIELRNERDKIRKQVSSIEEVDNEIREIEKLTSVEAEVTDVIDLTETRRRLQSQFDSFYALASQLKKTNNSIKKKEAELEEIEKRFDTEMEGACPLCGRSCECSR